MMPGALNSMGLRCVGVDGAVAVDGLAQRVHDAAEHGTADGDVHDAPRRAALVALLDGVDVAEQDGADLVLVEVLGEAIDRTARGGAGELEQLACHRAVQAGDVRDAVAHLGDCGRLLLVDRGVIWLSCSRSRAMIAVGADLRLSLVLTSDEGGGPSVFADKFELGLESRRRSAGRAPR
jgi:hypothetical protein